MSFMPFRDVVGTFYKRRRLATMIDRISTMDGLAVETYVIGSGQGAVRSADLAASIFEALKGLLETRC